MIFKYSKDFLSDISKLNKKQVEQLKDRLKLFSEHPTDPSLRNHKLKGKLKGYCSINISGDIRALYIMEKDESNNLVIYFSRLGRHSELYG